VSADNGGSARCTTLRFRTTLLPGFACLGTSFGDPLTDALSTFVSYFGRFVKPVRLFQQEPGFGGGSLSRLH